MQLLLKLTLFVLFVGSVLLALLLCGVFADSFKLPYPGWVRMGIVRSIVVFGLLALAAGLCLFPTKKK